jgi:hypothetical protein
MLFKHGEENNDKKPVADKTAPDISTPVTPVAPKVPEKDVSPAALRELLEKNLKWSQIIYEQNRKINSKLFWTAFANWVRLLLLIGSFAVAAWFLPPIIGNMIKQYQELTGSVSAVKSGANPDDLCKLLPQNMQESCLMLINKPK